MRMRARATFRLLESLRSAAPGGHSSKRAKKLYDNNNNNNKNYRFVPKGNARAPCLYYYIINRLLATHDTHDPAR